MRNLPRRRRSSLFECSPRRRRSPVLRQNSVFRRGLVARPADARPTARSATSVTMARHAADGVRPVALVACERYHRVASPQRALSERPTTSVRPYTTRGAPQCGPDTEKGPRYPLSQLFGARSPRQNSSGDYLPSPDRAGQRQGEPIDIGRRTAGKAPTVNDHRLRPELHYVVGEGHDGLDDRLHATYARAGPEVASSTSERRRLGTHADRHPRPPPEWGFP